MTFHRVPFYIGGGPEGNPSHPADLVRQVLLSSGNGVTGATALQPRASSPVSTQVRLAAGGAVIQGKAQASQGPYAAYNSGDLIVTMPANNTGATRTDMIVIRVEDPDFEGTKNRMTDNLIYAEVITGVGVNARTLAEAGKPGYSAIPIARVTRPSSTNNVSQANIADIRQLAQPRTEFVQASLQHDYNAVQSIALGQGIVNFPSSGFTTVRVPEWATSMDVAITCHGVRLYDNLSGGTKEMYGAFYIQVASTTFGSSIFNKDWTTTYEEFSAGTGASIDCRAWQGTDVIVRSRAEVRASVAGHKLEAVDTSTIIQCYFAEKPVPFS